MFYIVAKTVKSGFIGQFPLDVIAAMVARGELQADYVAIESNGLSYSQLVKSGDVRWLSVSQLLSGHTSSQPRNSSPAAGTHTKPADNTLWSIVLRICGVGIFVSGIAGLLLSEDSRFGWFMLVLGMTGAVQSFFLAFLVDVFVDIRSLLRRLANFRPPHL